MALRMANLRCPVAAAIRARLDSAIVGHAELKHGVMLGLLAREHVYIEGPPGVGKTMAAEIAARGLDSYFYQFHRDTRMAELIGDSVLKREPGPAVAGATSSSEIISVENQPGGILTTDVCILDDISRAPGEALSVLLRVLNERKYGAHDIPLLSAVATANPGTDDYYTNPLDPAAIDRFTIQIRAEGLVRRHDWRQAAVLIDEHHLGDGGTNATPVHASLSILNSAYRELGQVSISPRCRQLIVRLMHELQQNHGLTSANALLSDRTFLRKSLKLLQAQAHSMGRAETLPEDLHVLRYLTTFRIPADVHAEIAMIIQRIIDEPDHTTPLELEDDGNDGNAVESDDENGNGDENGETEQGDTNKDDPGDDETEEQSAGQQSAGDPGDSGLPAESMESNTEATSGADGDSDHADGEQRSLPSVRSMKEQSQSSEGDTAQDDDQVGLGEAEVENVELLLRVLRGRIERGKAEALPHPGGLPRHYTRVDTLEDFDDTDLVEMLLWNENPSPQFPRRLKRYRIDGGGSLALLRDTSMSMEGRWSKWAESLTTQIVGLARRKKMRIGYMEFNHRLNQHLLDDRFFVRDYEAIDRLARNADCAGVTDYQLPIGTALHEFQQLPGGKFNRHILFLTDGLPTTGCRQLTKEIKLARQLGVSIHTLFIGTQAYPKILKRVASATRGSQFRAAYDVGSNMISVTEQKPTLDDN